MIKKIILLASAALLFSVLLVSCSKTPETPDEDEKKTYETTDGAFDFQTSNSKIKLNYSDGGLSVISVDENGFEWVSDPLEYNFFDDIGYTFTYTGASVSEDGSEKTVVAKYVSNGGLEYYSTVIARKNYGIIEIGGRFVNTADGKIEISLPTSFRTSLKNTDGMTVTAYKKESGAAEGLLKYKKTGEGYTAAELKNGKSLRSETKVFSDWNSNGYIPLQIITDGERGIVFGFESCECNLETKDNGDGSLTLTASLSMGAFSTNVADEFDVPPVYLGVFSGCADNGTNLFKRWFFDNKSPAKLRNDPAEPLVQGYLDVSLSKLSSLNFQSCNIDYGWWTNENGKSYEGSWVLRNNTYSSNLNGSFSNFSKLRNSRTKDIVNLTAYVLLHDTTDVNGNPTDEFGEFNSKTHPEWFSSRKVTVGASADLGNTECVDYLKTALTDFFVSADAHTWRSDFEPICYRSDKENRHKANGTDVSYWCSVGFYDILDHLYKNVDNFRYECCSAGGSLKDYATLRYATVINSEDTWNYLSCRMVFWDSSWCIPPAQIQLNCCVESFCSKSFSETAYGRLFYLQTDVDQNAEGFEQRMQLYGIRSTLMGVPGFNSIGSASRFGCEDLLAQNIETYKTKIKDLVKYGELYHILPRPDGVNWDGIMYADPDTQNEIKGLIMLFKPSDKQGNVMHVTPEGLDGSKTYSLVFEDRPEQNVDIKGDELMKNGLDVKIEEELGSEMIWIYEK